MGQTLIIIEVSFIIMEVLYGGFTMYRSMMSGKLHNLYEGEEGH